MKAPADTGFGDGTAGLTVLLATLGEREGIIQSYARCYPCCRTLALHVSPIKHDRY